MSVKKHFENQIKTNPNLTQEHINFYKSVLPDLKSLFGKKYAVGEKLLFFMEKTLVRVEDKEPYPALRMKSFLLSEFPEMEKEFRYIGENQGVPVFESVENTLTIPRETLHKLNKNIITDVLGNKES